MKEAGHIVSGSPGLCAQSIKSVQAISEGANNHVSSALASLSANLLEHRMVKKGDIIVLPVLSEIIESPRLFFRVCGGEMGEHRASEHNLARALLQRATQGRLKGVQP
jgi:hypothetical protein